MTKRRAPLTIDAALARIAGQLPGGYGEMADIAGRKERTVRNWGDPDTPEQIPMDCAIKLDLAYQQADGIGAPIFETYACQLEAAGVARFATRIELGHLAARSAAESGEAHAAMIRAALPGASDAEVAAAVREIGEAVELLHHGLSLLEARPPP